jgi:hypothetical protein
MARVNVTELITKDTPTPTQQTPTPPPDAPPKAQKPKRRPSSSTQLKAAPTAPQEATQSPETGPKQRPSDPPEPEGVPGEKRITLPLWQALWRALQLARVDDGIDTTIRIRSMIELWVHDDRIRTRVDKLAKQRASTLSRGRPRRDR